MTQIKFGTDGWRAIIAEDFTTDNVARVAEAVALWLKDKKQDPVVVLGHDCRFAGALFADTIRKVLTHHGVTVKYHVGVCSTPMVSLGARELNADLGVIITASHNPPGYNGFKLKGGYGGPLGPEQTAEIEALIPDSSSVDFTSADDLSGMGEKVDLEGLYLGKLKQNFDLDAIKSSGLNWAYDAMFGAGYRVMQELFPESLLLHCEHNPGFQGQAPEPIEKNLKPFQEAIREHGSISCGLATDGDADRLGMFDGDGKFVDSHHLILLLIHYLVKYKGLEGKVVTAFSCTPRIEKMCKHYGIEHQTVKIGFKYVAEIMTEENVLLGGEESGGIATCEHIPERDGIWMGLTLWEFMAKSGKTLHELIDEVYAIVGPFSFERNDLHITEELKQSAMQRCENGSFKSVGGREVKRVETTDGYKFFFDNDRWLMIRPSGTEPVLRTYAEAPTMDEVREILADCEKEIRSAN